MRPSSRHSVREKVQALNQRNMNSYALHQVHQSEETGVGQRHQIPPSPSWQTQFHQITPSPSPPKSHRSHIRSPSIGSDMVTEPSVAPSTPESSTYMSEFTLRNSHSFPPETTHTTNLRAPHSNLPKQKLFYQSPQPATASAATFGFPMDDYKVEDGGRSRSRTVSTFSGILSNNNNNTSSSRGGHPNQQHGEEEADSELLSRRESDNTIKKEKDRVTINTTLKPTTSSSCSTKSSTYTLTPTSDIEFDEGEFRPAVSIVHPTTSWGVPKSYIFLLAGLYVVGVVASVGNHLLFAYLNNHKFETLHPFGKNTNFTPVWVERLSVFLPIVVVSCYNSILGLCLGQTAWATVRRPRDGISIRGIDALFSLSRDIRSPFRLLASLRDVSFYTVAASIIAVAGWFTPLIVVFVPATLSHNGDKWTYKPLALAISYGSATLIASIALLGGLLSVKSNGVVQETGFAGFLCATRNRELDDVLRGYSMGGAGVRSGTAGKVRLLFGETERVGAGGSGNIEERHVAFGLVGRVMDVQKGGLYS